MKKRLFYGILAVIATVLLGSCDDEIVSTPVTINLLPKANITGIVTAELDLQQAGEEPVPEGTLLFVEVNYSDINPSAFGKWADTVAVAAGGRYEIAVPADADGVSVVITPMSFEAGQKQAYRSYYPEITKVYNAPSVTVMIRSGMQVSQNLSYTGSDSPLFVEKIWIAGQFKANLDAEQIGLENVPDGTIINFYNNGWKGSVAVVNGEYTIEVPKGLPVYWKSAFTYSKRVWKVSQTVPSESGYEQVNYEYKLSGGPATFNEVTENYDFSAGEGTDLTEGVDPNIVLLSGKALAELDLTASGSEQIPNGVKIYFYTSTWGANAVVSSGNYNIEIPRGQVVNYYLNFTAMKKTGEDASALYSYTLTGTLIYNSETASFDFNAGNGVLQ